MVDPIDFCALLLLCLQLLLLLLVVSLLLAPRRIASPGLLLSFSWPQRLSSWKCQWKFSGCRRIS